RTGRRAAFRLQVACQTDLHAVTSFGEYKLSVHGAARVSDENRLDLLFAGFIVFLLAGVVTVAMGIRRELRTGVIGQHPPSGLWRRPERPARGLPVCARPRAALSVSALPARGRTPILGGLSGLDARGR